MKHIRLIRITLLLCFMLASADCSRHNSGARLAATAADSSAARDSSSNSNSILKDGTLTYEEFEGKHVYEKFCAVCHGVEGKGDGFNAFNLDPKPRDFTDSARMSALTDDRIVQTIRGGRKKRQQIITHAFMGRETGKRRCSISLELRPPFQQKHMISDRPTILNPRSA